MLYDKEARGYLPLDEFKKILKEIDPQLPEDELDEIIDEIDADGSGTIDFDGKCNKSVVKRDLTRDTMRNWIYDYRLG